MGNEPKGAFKGAFYVHTDEVLDEGFIIYTAKEQSWRFTPLVLATT